MLADARMRVALVLLAAGCRVVPVPSEHDAVREAVHDCIARLASDDLSTSAIEIVPVRPDRVVARVAFEKGDYRGSLTTILVRREGRWRIHALSGALAETEPGPRTPSESVP